jgi:hypothetical protein
VRLFNISSSALRCIIVIALAITSITFTGCGSAAFSPAPTTKVPMTAEAAVEGSSSTPPVLLFNGTGTSSSDVAAVEAILNTLKLSYATTDSKQMDSMTETQLKAYKLLIVPGGNSITIGDNLSKTATTNIHNAVDAGLHYLGICAGAFFGGYSEYNGLNLTSGVWFNLYSDRNAKDVVTISFPKNSSMDIYWQDGPELAGWGSIVGEYPNGQPAIVEGKSGSGWVILSGVHPEAPASWRTGMKFKTPLATDLAYAGTLVTYALKGDSLPHY